MKPQKMKKCIQPAVRSFTIATSGRTNFFCPKT